MTIARKTTSEVVSFPAIPETTSEVLFSIAYTCAIDLAHAALAERFENFIRADSGAGCEGHTGGSSIRPRSWNPQPCLHQGGQSVTLNPLW